MHRRWRWPPETLVPPCSMYVSYLSGNSWMKPSACASWQAWRISSSVAFGLPQRRFSAMVPENSTFFCSTMATWSRRTSMS